MYIRVRFTPNLRRTVRLSFYLRRSTIVTEAVLGAFVVIVGLWADRMEPDFRGAAVALGALMIIWTPLWAWAQAYRSRQTEQEAIVTDEGVERRTDTMTVHLTWDMVDRVHELRDGWVFVKNKGPAIAVGKRSLSPEQQAELAAFLAARTKPDDARTV